MTYGDTVREISRQFGVEIPLLLGPRRTKRIAWARQAAWWLLYCHNDLSYPRLGLWFNRDHTTVLYGVRAAERRRQNPRDSEEAEFAATLNAIHQRCYAGLLGEAA